MMSDSIISDVSGRQTSLSSRESTLSNESDASIRSARAQKVFGDLVTQIETENSLCYSPSPFPRKQGLTEITNVCKDSPARVLPFGTIHLTTVKKTEKNQNVEKKTKDGKKNGQPSKARSANEKVGSKASKKVAFKMTKNDDHQINATIEKRDKKNGQEKNYPKKRKAMETKHRYSSTHQNQASRVEKAIRKATESVNETLNTSRAAKIDHSRHVAAEVARLKEEWRMEKEEASKFYAEMQKTKRERLDIANKISSQYARNKVDYEQSKMQQKLGDLDKEILFKSKVYVEHKRNMKENEDKRRRMSVAIKSKHRNCRTAKVEKMKLQSITETHEFYEHKWSGERDADEYKRQCEQERRDSFAFRGREHVYQRQGEAERQEAEKIKEHNKFELKCAGERDADEYKRQCEQERRDSFAFRGREHVHHRAVMEELKNIAIEKEHEYFVLKWAAQDDTKEYLSKMEEARRQSFAFRNAEGKRQRDLKEQWRCEEVQKSHNLERVQSECKFSCFVSLFRLFISISSLLQLRQLQVKKMLKNTRKDVQRGTDRRCASEERNYKYRNLFWQKLN